MGRNPILKSTEGIVYLVGAGPGDVGLLTLRGKEILQQADVVVYDALVGAGILSLIPEGTEKVYVGKRNHHHTLSQEEINQVLVEKAHSGKICVRLKGGDPYLFGRGGEEALELKKHGIPFEIVSGVTSAVAVPASVGIPVTHREYASLVHIITAHRKRECGKGNRACDTNPLAGSEDNHDELSEITASGQRISLDEKTRISADAIESEINYIALVQAGGTCVFLMGLTALSSIVKGFLDAGMRSDMPVAVISNGTTAAVRKTVATLATIEEQAAGMQAPAIIVVGDVCALSDELDTRSEKKLSGKRVIICSSERKKGAIAQTLRENGAEVIEKTMITVRSKPDRTALRNAIEEIQKYQWLVFTSPEGVRIFFEEWRMMSRDIRELVGVRIAVIGEKTAAEIESKCLKVDLIPAVHDGGAFGKELAKVIQPGECVLIPRAEQGGASLVDEISQVKDVKIMDLPIYETVQRIEQDESLRALVGDDVETMLVFTSASSVKSFLAATSDMDYNHCRCSCIGNQTKTAAQKLNIPCYVSEEASMESLLSLVLTTKVWS